MYQTSEKKLSGQNLAGKVITRVHIHFALQAARAPVDIPGLSSQSERAKNNIQQFGVYGIAQT